MPRIVDRARQREVLLEACFRVFAEHGYASATMRQLAKAAGVSTGALYHYFPDKQSILAALFDLQLRRDVDRVKNSLPADASVPVRIRVLFAFFREHADYLRDLLRLALEVHRHEPSPESRQQIVDALRRYRQALADILGIEGALVHMAFSFLIGSLAHGILDPEGVDIGDQERFVQEVWEQLGGR